MEYLISATAKAGQDALLEIKQSSIAFGTTENTADQLPNPAELFLGAFAACLLKNVERFSGLLHFDYDRASVQVSATREARPPHLDDLQYELIIFSKDERLNLALLKKNLEQYGTIFNTVQKACTITGSVIKKENYV